MAAPHGTPGPEAEAVADEGRAPDPGRSLRAEDSAEDPEQVPGRRLRGGEGETVALEQEQEQELVESGEPADAPSQSGPAGREPDATAAPAQPELPTPPTLARPETEAEPEAVDDGRFTVRLANFEGPFDLLLQLISKHKLDVTEVALSQVTDEFMVHIRAMGPDWDLDQTTEFLVVAATLLDLKAARLLPAAEVEDEADLALLEARDLLFARLLQYRAYQQAAALFVELEEGAQQRFPRSVALEDRFAALLPEVLLGVDATAFAELAAAVFRPKPPPTVGLDHLHVAHVSVAEHAALLRERLAQLGTATFGTLSADCVGPLEVVARFLAVLDLYRQADVELDQPEAFGELTVRWAR